MSDTEPHGRCLIKRNGQAPAIEPLLSDLVPPGCTIEAHIIVYADGHESGHMEALIGEMTLADVAGYPAPFATFDDALRALHTELARRQRSNPALTGEWDE